MANVSREGMQGSNGLTSVGGVESGADVIPMPGMEMVGPERVAALRGQMLDLLGVISQRSDADRATAFASTMSGLSSQRFGQIETEFADILQMARAGAGNITARARVGQIPKYATDFGGAEQRVLLRRSLNTGKPGKATPDVQLPQLPDAALLQTERHRKMIVDVQEIPNAWHGDGDGTHFELPETEVMPSFSALFVKSAVHTKNPEDAELLEVLYEQIDQLSDYQVVEVALLSLAAYRLMQHSPNYGSTKVDRTYEHLGEYLAGKTDAEIAGRTVDSRSDDLSHVRRGRRKAMERLTNVREYVGAAIVNLLNNPQMRILEQRGNQFRFTPVGVMHLTAMARAPYDPETSVTPFMRRNTSPSQVQDQMGEFFSQARDAYQRSLSEEFGSQLGMRLQIIDAHIQGTGSDQIAQLFDVLPSIVRNALDDFSRFVAGENVPQEFQATLAAGVLTEGPGEVVVTVPTEDDQLPETGLADEQAAGVATGFFVPAVARMIAMGVADPAVAGAVTAEALADPADGGIEDDATDGGPATEEASAAGADLSATSEGALSETVAETVDEDPDATVAGGALPASDEAAVSDPAQGDELAEAADEDQLAAEDVTQADALGGETEQTGQSELKDAEATDEEVVDEPLDGEDVDGSTSTAAEGAGDSAANAKAGTLAEAADPPLPAEDTDGAGAAADELAQGEQSGAEDVGLDIKGAADNSLASGVAARTDALAAAAAETIELPEPRIGLAELLRLAGPSGHDVASLAAASGMPERHVAAVIANVLPRVTGAAVPIKHHSAMTGTMTVHYAGRGLQAIGMELVGIGVEEISNALHVPIPIIRTALDGQAQPRSNGRYGLDGWELARLSFPPPERGSEELSVLSVSVNVDLKTLISFIESIGGRISEHYGTGSRKIQFVDPHAARIVRHQSAGDVVNAETNWISRADVEDPAHFDRWIVAFSVGVSQMRWMRTRRELPGIDRRGVALPHYHPVITGRYLADWKRAKTAAARAATAQAAAEEQ